MEFSQNTTTLLQQLEAFSGKRLNHKNEVGLFIELAYRYNELQTLADLSFYAKFAHKTLGIMKRIGKEAEGYDKLSKEFGESVERAKNSLNVLLSHTSGNERKKFNSQFMAMSPGSFEALLSLFYDLSWYKNYLIDSRER